MRWLLVELEVRGFGIGAFIGGQFTPAGRNLKKCERKIVRQFETDTAFNSNPENIEHPTFLTANKDPQVWASLWLDAEAKRMRNMVDEMISEAERLECNCIIPLKWG